MTTLNNTIGALYSWGASLPPAGLYAFVFAWLFIESTGFPISDEPLLLLAGYLTTQGRLNLALTVALALVGKVAASCLAYWLGRSIRLRSLARPATRPSGGLAYWLYAIRPTSAFVLATEAMFRRYGAWGVFLGRLIPVVRSFISYPAGAARMRFTIFLLATTIGSLLWIVAWTTLGATLGRAYESALTQWGAISWVVLGGAVVGLIVLWVWAHRRAERYGEQLALAEHSLQNQASQRPASAVPPAKRKSAARTRRASHLRRARREHH